MCSRRSWGCFVATRFLTQPGVAAARSVLGFGPYPVRECRCFRSSRVLAPTKRACEPRGRQLEPSTCPRSLCEMGWAPFPVPREPHDQRDRLDTRRGGRTFGLCSRARVAGAMPRPHLPPEGTLREDLQHLVLRSGRRRARPVHASRVDTAALPDRGAHGHGASLRQAAHGLRVHRQRDEHGWFLPRLRRLLPQREWLPRLHVCAWSGDQLTDQSVGGDPVRSARGSRQRLPLRARIGVHACGVCLRRVW